MVDYFTCKQHQCWKYCVSFILQSPGRGLKSHYVRYYTNVKIIFGNNMMQQLFSLICVVATLPPSLLICGSHKFISPGTKLRISSHGQSHPHRHCKTREIKQKKKSK